jgi:hypothetical protein
MITDHESNWAHSGLRDHESTAMLLSGMCSREPEAIRRHRQLVQAVLADGGEPSAGSLMVLARCAELEGRAEEHEELVLQALGVDRLLPCALAELSWVLSDRGNAPGALVMFDLSGAAAVDRERFSLLHLLAMAGPVHARRNQQCPCGTGKKYKRCCATTGGWPLQTRAVWVIEKAMTFAARPAQRDAAMELVRLAADEDLTPGELEALAAGRIAREAALFEEGLLERFQAERASLLPADEAELLETWIGARQRVLRCGPRADEGKGGRVTDLVTGEVLDLAYIQCDIHEGELVVGAPLPNADGHLSLFMACFPPEEVLDRLVSGWAARGARALIAIEAMLRKG